MATINIPVGGGTFTANSGDVFNIPAGATGDIFINGATDFTVNILGDLTGDGGDNLRLIQFGTDTQPTVNIPAGVDTSPYAINANGETLTLNVGDGAIIGDVDGSNLNPSGTMTVSAGNNVTVQGDVENLGQADGVISFGSGASISGAVSGTAGGTADLDFGDNATIGGNVTGATGAFAGQSSSIVFGNGATLGGQVISTHSNGDRTVVFGDDANVANAINLSGASTGGAFLTMGDNAVVVGNINGTGNDDRFIIGNNHDLANINMLLGDDTINIGTQAVGAGLTQIDGGSPNGSDFDLIRIGVRPDQQADFDAAGWINNGDGTYSSPGPAFNGSPVIGGDLTARDFEGAAAPVPDGVVDGEATAENMALGYDDSTGATDGGGDQITAGDDSIAGNAGDDTINGSTGNDTIDGGADNDSLIGGAGNDSLIGGSGNDTLLGSEGNDTLEGGDGDDVLRPGAGSDTVLGGAGNDTLELSDNDFLDGGDDTDVLDATFGNFGETISFNADNSGDTGANNSTFQNIEVFQSDGGADSYDATAATGPLNISTGADDDTILGGSGADTLDGGTGDDSLDGGDGADSLIGGDGADTLTGGLGDDTLDGGAGDDDFVLGSGDVATGGGGDDEFILDPTNTDGPGTITIDGGADATSGDPAGTENADAGDILDFTGLSNVTIVTPLVNDGTGSFSGQVSYTNDEGETILVDFTEIEQVLGLPAPDGVVDGEAAGEVMGLGYDDSAGPTDGGGDQITAGDDSIAGNGGADTIDGGAGNDTIHGGADDDVISGGLGDDSLIGGDGNDSFLFEDNFGTDTVFGGSVGDTDTIDFSGVTSSGVTVTFSQSEDGTATDGTDTIGFDNIEAVTGSNQADTIDASADNSGLALRGGGGDDTIAGGDGDDLIEGGTGNDTLTGGLGNDTFAYAPGDGLDVITDFNAGNTGPINDGDSTNNDFIDLSGYYNNLHELWADYADDATLNQSNAFDTLGDAVDYSGRAQQFAPGEGIQFTGGTADAATFTTDNTNVICFAPGTLIRTPSGPIPIERLAEGDLVVTRDNGVQPLLWAGQKTLSQADLIAAPNLRPIWLSGRCYGLDRDLVVSPQHGVLLHTPEHGGSETLFRAKHLAELPKSGARVMKNCRGITYHHLMFAEHQIICANGMWSESLYPGASALASLGAAPRAEILHLFPQLLTNAVEHVYGPATAPYSRTQHLPETGRYFSRAS